MGSESQRTLRIWLLQGLPGSGKSTWAKEQVKQFPLMYKRVNKDELRAMIDDGKWSKSNEQFVLRIRNQIIREALTAGYDAVVDDTNFAPQHKQTMDIIAGEFPKVEVVVKFFDTPLEECIFRDSKRENPVGAGIIRKMWNDYLRPQPVSYLPNLPEAIWVDIDGTIAEKGDRGQYDEEKVRLDKPIKSIIDILQTYKKSKIITIIIVSGRHETCRRDTELWLLNNNIPYDELYMRPAGNNEKDFLIKKQIYEGKIRGKFNILFCLDDRNQVVDMLRGIGLKVLQCDFGGF